MELAGPGKSLGIRFWMPGFTIGCALPGHQQNMPVVSRPGQKCYVICSCTAIGSVPGWGYHILKGVNKSRLHGEANM